MADVQELLDALKDDFRRRCENDRKLKKITDTLEHGTYVDAHDYAVRVGEILSKSFAEVLTEDVYPDLTEEMARQLIPSLLGSGHRMTSNACVSVQTNLNKNAGLGLKPIEPEFDVGRAYDLAQKYISYDTWKDAHWVLGEPVENFMQSVPDDSIRRNADFQWRTGMSPKIIRKAEPGACKWCREVAGEYDYKDVRNTGNDVYRRHENCRCVVTYDPGDGRKQDVWSKAEWVGDDPEARRRAIEGTEEQRKVRERILLENRIKKSEAVDMIQKELGYSPKGASVWYNVHKEEIDRYGLEYMLDASRNANEYNRRLLSNPLVHAKTGSLTVDKYLEQKRRDQWFRDHFFDVGEEYFRIATPGIGNKTLDPKLYPGRIKDELQMRDYLFNVFGGDIHCINKDLYDGLSPDYIWNNKLWELKTPEEENGIRRLTEKGLKQITTPSIDYPAGGIIVDLSRNSATDEYAADQIIKRVAQQSTTSVDVIIVRDGNIVKIIRYKK